MVDGFAEVICSNEDAVSRADIVVVRLRPVEVTREVWMGGQES